MELLTVRAGQLEIRTHLSSLTFSADFHHTPQMRVSYVSVGLCVLLMVLASTGCVGTTGRAHGTSQDRSGLAAERITTEEIDDLISRLDSSPEKNRVARRQLIRIGEPAVPALRAALCIGTGRQFRKKKPVEKALRSLRVLRQMGTPAAIDVCQAILLINDTTRYGPEQWALLTEVIAYLCDNFDITEVRDSYVKFLYDGQNRYMGKIYFKQHWRGGGNRDIFRVDVTHAVSFMVKAGDPRAKDVLSRILKIVVKPGYGGSFVWHLSDDGYTVEVQQKKSSRESPWPLDLTNALKTGG